jgi:hypothetical protein
MQAFARTSFLEPFWEPEKWGLGSQIVVKPPPKRCANLVLRVSAQEIRAAAFAPLPLALLNSTRRESLAL